MSKPPKWQEDEITQFIESAKEQAYATFVKCPQEFAYLVELDKIFRGSIDCAHNSEHWFPCLFNLKAHSAFLAGTQLVMGTQSQEGYMVLRGALENALYGYHIYKNPDLAEVYLNRDDSAQTKREMRTKFQNKGIIESLKRDDEKLGNSVEKLYDMMIDFGAHPNEKSLTSSLRKTDIEGGVQFDIAYLTSDPQIIGLGLRVTTWVGIACLKIAELVLPERFKITGLSDRLESISKKF